MDIKAVVEMEVVPSDLILNWNYTGINIVPSSTWIMEAKGSKRVEAVGLNDKRQITAVFCAALSGELLPLQLIYQEKTTACLPRFILRIHQIIGLMNRRQRNTSKKSFCHTLKQNIRHMKDLTRQPWSTLMNLKFK